MEKFSDLGLSAETLKVLETKGFELPTPIQAKTIPLILSDSKDMIGQAQTGTGKTAAFGLPILELIKEKSKHVQAIILAPTRELAIQVSEELYSLKGKKKISIVPIYGGQSIELQLRQLKKGVDIVVGTPGRVIDHINRKTLKLQNVSFLVLDEADEMLNMGFLEDVEEIMSSTPDDKRTMLFSATMPREILSAAKKHMQDYDIVKVTQGQLTTKQTEQIYFEVAMSDRFEALCRIIDIEQDFYGLIFCRTKVDVDRVSNHLTERGYDSDALHGDISQAQREKIMNKFKKKKINVLVATDVAARGIDVNDLSHVINYALPQDPESYVHRIGRTGRAGKEGIAITFITPSEYRKLQFIQRHAKTDIKKQTLPKVEDLIAIKKGRIKQEVESVIDTALKSEYVELAGQLLEVNDPASVVAALLQSAYRSELSEEGYREIKDARSNHVDKKGKTRLFIGEGKEEGMSARKLIDLMVEKSGVEPNEIRDVLVLDRFSFATLPFYEAELVLSSFKKDRRGRGPMVSKAREKGRDGGSSRSSGNRSGGRSSGRPSGGRPPRRGPGRSSGKSSGRPSNRRSSR